MALRAESDLVRRDSEGGALDKFARDIQTDEGGHNEEAGLFLSIFVHPSSEGS